MKIIDVTVCKEAMEGGEIGLAFRCTLEDGTQIAAAAPWCNTRGIWASTSEAREPAEIVATLRLFAKALEERIEQAKAA